VPKNRPLPDALAMPHPDRCGPRNPHWDEILRRHRAAMASGEATYVDPASSFVVFTAQFLWDRGYCCDTGCRHCPYVERPRG